MSFFFSSRRRHTRSLRDWSSDVCSTSLSPSHAPSCISISTPGGPLSVVDPSLSNNDLRPTTPAQRTWTMYNSIALWFSMSMEITTYKLASGLIDKGMDWKQAVGTVLLGNLIVLVPMLLNAHAGAKYGIPFPVFIRAPFGVRGA